jgi:hypothetical protein
MGTAFFHSVDCLSKRKVNTNVKQMFKERRNLLVAWIFCLSLRLRPPSVLKPRVLALVFLAISETLWVWDGAGEKGIFLHH